MKFNDILKSAIANLMRNKVRSILTMIAIFVGTFAIALVGGLNVGVNNYLDDQLESIGGEDLILIFPEAMLGMGMGGDPALYDPDVPTEGMNVEAINAIDGIEDAVGFVNLSIDYIVGTNEERYTFAASGDEHETFIISLEAGEQLNNHSDEFEILLDSNYVEVLGFSSSEAAIDQLVTIAVSSAYGERTMLEATIVGVIESSLISGGTSRVNWTLEDEIHRINEEGLPESIQGQIWAVGAVLESGWTEDQLIDIRAALEELGYVGQTIEEQFVDLSNIMNAITSVLVMFGAISLLAASFGIINTLYMSVQERTREIGLMKAMGLSRSKVFRIFSWEATLIGFVGSLLGVLGAMGAGSLVNQVATDSFLEGLPGLTLIQFTIPIVSIIILIIMSIAFLAGTLPARRASKLDPIIALRTE